MPKRSREEDRQVFLRHMGPNVRSEAVNNLFSQVGRIESIRFLDRRTCRVLFDQADAVQRALRLHQTQQHSLCTSSLTVVFEGSKPKAPPKKRAIFGSFVVLDPPRFNNFLIPVLPSFLNNES